MICKFMGPTPKKLRLAIILDYHVYNITIILGECCPEKKQKYIVTFFVVGVYFIIVGVFFIIVVFFS